MFELETSRLYLVETPLRVVETRLQQDEFDAKLLVGGQVQQVHFPAEWPADALGFFPGLAVQLRQYPDAESWGGVLILIENAEMVAVGNMGTKGPPDSTGTVDIGYGMNPSYEGRGYMTEAVQGFAAWLLARPEVVRVTADCLKSNTASVRVLEKAGFVQLSERFDAEEGGILVFWERTA
jgi:[ribosomal protein S5]-alanine N-acetyltransferase